MRDDLTEESGARTAGPTVTDAELIGRSRTHGDCFTEIYRRHAAAVQGYVTRRLGPQAAEDVVAETFIAAFRARNRYDTGREDARAWLFGIATRQISARRRTERAWYRKVEVACPEPPAELPTDEVAARVAAQAVRGPLATALARLKARDRDVLLLVAWADLSYLEVAEALNVPVGTVRSRLHRARRVVRDALAQSGVTLEEGSA